MPQRWRLSDIEELLGSSFSAFCEQFEITSRTDKQAALEALARTARAMKGRQ